MKKKQPRKLTLTKETLLQLQNPGRLEDVAGGVSGMDSCGCGPRTPGTEACVTYWGPPC